MVDDDEDKKHIPQISLDEEDIAMFKSYASGPYDYAIRKVEEDIKELTKKVNETREVEECDMGLAPRSQWDLRADKMMMAEDKALWVYKCKSIHNPDSEDAKYVVASSTETLCVSNNLSPTDVEEGMRVGLNKQYEIALTLPPRIDNKIKMLIVEDIPNMTYDDVGGCKEEIRQIREVVEWPILHPEKFLKLGLDPPKGVLCYGPPGTGKTLVARAVANRTAACFIRVIGTELVQKYASEGASMVREIFQLARSKGACIIFFDEVDAIGGERFGDGSYGDNEIQRTMLEIVNQLDGFDPRGNIKVLMATNRPDSLDPALMRPGRLDRKVEFGLPDLKGRVHIFKIHTRLMNCEKDIRYELLARLCPNTSGADIRSVCTEAGMFAIRAGRKIVIEKDFLDAVTKVVKGYHKFSAAFRQVIYN